MITRPDLSALRESAGLTQSKLAEKLGNGGYTATVVAAVERGKRNIGLALLERWATACGYDVKIEFVPRTGSSVKPTVDNPA